MENETATAPITDQGATTEATRQSEAAVPPEDAVFASIVGDLSPAERATLPPDFLETPPAPTAPENNDGGNPTITAAPEDGTPGAPQDADPENPPSATPKNPPPAADPGTPPAEPQNAEGDNDGGFDPNTLLAEELRASNARYSTLQGKYNSEIRALRAEIERLKSGQPAAPAPAPAPNDGTEKPNGDPAPNPAPAVNDKDEDQKLAERLGLDPEVISALRENFMSRIPKTAADTPGSPDIDDRVAALETERLNADLDAKIRVATGGLSLEQVGSQSLFNYATTKIKNDKGVSAAEILAKAHEKFDNDTIASVVATVVQEMKSNGLWEDRPGHFAVPVKPAAPPAAAGNPAPTPAAPVVPHVSGVPGNAALGQTRTVDIVERELDEAIRQVASGNPAAAPKVDKLRDEYFKLMGGNNAPPVS